MIDINSLKEQILSIVRREGPVLPVHISRKLGSDTYFAGAILSELVKSNAIRVSNAKIGGSPLYYINGQESKLDKLYPYLPGKEKEAYDLLRTRQVLQDKECDPPIRVALRIVKDFAYPSEVNGVLYWRWYLTSEVEAKKLIEDDNKGKLKKEIKVETYKQLNVEKKIESVALKKDNVVNSLKIAHIKIIEAVLKRKNREVEGKVQVNSDLGILDYYLLAKNKKTLNEADLSLANDSGRKNKLPVLFLTNGNLSKKAEKYLEENLKGRVIFRKI